MSTKDRTGLNNPDTIDSLANHLTAQIARSFTLGTDLAGYDHHYFRPADAVVVYDRDPDTNQIDHVEHLDGEPLDDWHAFIARERGWATLGPHASTGLEHDAARKGVER